MAVADPPDGSHSAVGPRVFISYAHDDEPHKEQVSTLAYALSDRGVQVEIDLWYTHIRQDWAARVIELIDTSDYVLVVASRHYHDFGGGGTADAHHGVQHEAAQLRERLYNKRAIWLPKLLPIVLSGHTVEEIPEFLQPRSATHFLVKSFDDPGLEELLRVLTGQPRHLRPPLGPRRDLPPHTGGNPTTPNQHGQTGQAGAPPADSPRVAGWGPPPTSVRPPAQPPPPRATSQRTAGQRGKNPVVVTGVVIVVTTVLAVAAVVLYVALHLSQLYANAATHTVTTIGVGAQPEDVALDSADHTAYVANNKDNSVSVIDTTTNTVTATVGVGTGPWGVAVDPGTHTAYVTSNSDGSVSVVDTTTNTVTGTIGVGPTAFGVAVDTAANTAYVTNFDNSSVSVIDTTTNTVTATVGVGSGPYGVAVDPATHTAYVANSTGSSVSVIDTATNTVVATIGVSSMPSGVAVDTATNTAYITSVVGNDVSVVNTATNTVTTTISVGSGSAAIGVDSAAHDAYVINSDDSVSVIDTATNTVTTRMGVGLVPFGVAVDPTTHVAYVTDSGGKSVSVIKAS